MQYVLKGCLLSTPQSRWQFQAGRSVTLCWSAGLRLELGQNTRDVKMQNTRRDVNTCWSFCPTWRHLVLLVFSVLLGAWSKVAMTALLGVPPPTMPLSPFEETFPPLVLFIYLFIFTLCFLLYFEGDLSCFCIHRIRRGVWCVRTCCIPIITLLHRSQNGQASHWLSLSCLPHNSTSNAFARTIPQLLPRFKAHMLKCSFSWVRLS